MVHATVEAKAFTFHRNAGRRVEPVNPMLAGDAPLTHRFVDTQVVSELIVIKGVFVVGGRSDAPLVPFISRDSYRRRGLSRSAAQRQVLRCGINRSEGQKVERMTAAETNSPGIDKARTERVAFFEHNGLPSGV